MARHCTERYGSNDTNTVPRAASHQGADAVEGHGVDQKVG